MSTCNRVAGLLLFTTALSCSGAAFAQVAEPEAPATEEPGPEPDDEQPRAADISIPGGAIVVTGRRSQDVTRSSSQVVSILTSEAIARTGEGDIAGALGRVTGLSVQGNGFVYVRGLGDRYSLALLNGLPLPSPEQLSRVVPLDIFPTGIVASSLVQKTYSANFPGEFGGGVINLTTIAIPDESFFEISAGISGDEQTTFSPGLTYYGSDYDWFGFDDGTRSVPPALREFFDSGLRISDPGVDQQAILRQLGNPNLVLIQRNNDIPANLSGGITAGTAFDFGDGGRMGVIATASLSNKWRTRSIVSQTAVNADLDLDTDFREFVTDNRILVNGLLGFGFELGEQRLRWTNLYIRDSLKRAALAVGEDFQDDDSEARQDTAWFERQLIDSQLVGEFKVGDLGLSARAGYAQTRRKAPYEYSFTYVRTNNPNDPLGDTFVNKLNRQTGSASVAFSKLKEDLYYAGLDATYPVTDWLRVTTGYAYTDTERYSERRQFLINASNDFDGAVGALRPDLLLGDAVIDFYRIGLIESTQSDPAFSAELTIHAGYAQAFIQPLVGVALDIGVRYEDAKQRVDPVEVFGVPTNSGTATFLANDYWLPAATLTWEITDALQARFNASKTIARPQFRELIFQTYFDPETNRQFNGNPRLVDSRLTNAEARLEYYFGRGNRVSVAGFWKDIRNPIEVFSSFSDNDQISGFANAPKATLYGAELETQATYPRPRQLPAQTNGVAVEVEDRVFAQRGEALRLVDHNEPFLRRRHVVAETFDIRAFIGCIAARQHDVVHRPGRAFQLARHDVFADIAGDIHRVRPQATDHPVADAMGGGLHEDLVVALHRIELDNLHLAVPHIEAGARDPLLIQHEIIGILGADHAQLVEADAPLHRNRRIHHHPHLIIVAGRAQRGAGVVADHRERLARRRIRRDDGGRRQVDGEGARQRAHGHEIIAIVALDPQLRTVGIHIHHVVAGSAMHQQRRGVAGAQPAARRRRHAREGVLGQKAAEGRIPLQPEQLADLHTVVARAHLQRRGHRAVVHERRIIAAIGAHMQPAFQAVVVVDALHLGRALVARILVEVGGEIAVQQRDIGALDRAASLRRAQHEDVVRRAGRTLPPVDEQLVLVVAVAAVLDLHDIVALIHALAAQREDLVGVTARLAIQRQHMVGTLRADGSQRRKLRRRGHRPRVLKVEHVKPVLPAARQHEGGGAEEDVAIIAMRRAARRSARIAEIDRVHIPSGQHADHALAGHLRGHGRAHRVAADKAARRDQLRFRDQPATQVHRAAVQDVERALIAQDGDARRGDDLAGLVQIHVVAHIEEHVAAFREDLAAGDHPLGIRMVAGGAAVAFGEARRALLHQVQVLAERVRLPHLQLDVAEVGMRQQQPQQPRCLRDMDVGPGFERDIGTRRIQCQRPDAHRTVDLQGIAGHTDPPGAAIRIEIDRLPGHIRAVVRGGIQDGAIHRAQRHVGLRFHAANRHVLRDLIQEDAVIDRRQHVEGVEPAALAVPVRVGSSRPCPIGRFSRHDSSNGGSCSVTRF
ncbi:TonB-dependent receptor [Leptolyngbya sp. 15MV]|nr:TonB-dependent receptor [Leptolyngbya sp. 15MV]